MDHPIAYLAGGKIHVRDNDRQRTFDSKFGQDLRQRVAQSQRKNAWKTQGMGARFMSAGLTPRGEDPDSMRIAITHLSPSPKPGELLYALDAGDISGGLAIVLEDGYERRLFHHNGLTVKFLQSDPQQDLVTCAVGNEDAVHVNVMRADGSQLRELSDGDSVDLAPRSIPGVRHQLVYQSAGVGRNAQGAVVGLAPFALYRLDVDGGDITPLLEEPAHDLLSPVMTEDGTLFYIQRPYKKVGSDGPALEVVFLYRPTAG